MLIKSQSEVHLHTGRSVHFHPGQCARPSFSIFRGSGFDTMGAMPPRLIFCGATAPNAPPPPSSTAYGLQVAISEHAQLHTLVVGVTTS